MTAETRFDRDLPAILEDLYLGPSPDYRNEVMAAAVRTRQRPSWTFAGRWFPMADIAGRSALAPRIPWRTIGMAVLVVALALAAVALVVGSRQTKVPPPFGLARNGLILYSASGDIFTADPITGATTRLVGGPSADLDAAFSPDGTRIAFSRLGDGERDVTLNIVVADADGSHDHVVTSTPLAADGLRFEWAADSRSIAVQTAEREIWLLDSATQASPRVLTSDAELYLKAARPPDGGQLLIKRTPSMNQIVVLDIASGDERVIAEGGMDDFGAARWSLDGSQVVYNASAPEDRASQRLWIVNADGTGAHQITDAPGTWFDIDPTWSPDGKWIAFTRYERTSTTPVTWEVRPLGIYEVATGKVRYVGPLPREVRAQHPSSSDAQASAGEGFWLEWSPDATSLLAAPSEASGHHVIIDPGTNRWRVMDAVVEQGLAMQAWQRTAP